MAIRYRAHVTDFGWQEPVEDGAIAGTIGEGRALEAFRIEELGVEGLGVHAFAHVQDLGWSSGNLLNEDVGSTGLGKHIEAVKVGLIGPAAGEYDLFYRLHVKDKGFLNWSKNGELNGTEGGNVQAEAIQFMLVKKGTNVYPVSDTSEAYFDLTPPPAPEPAPQTDKREQALALARSYVGYTTGTSNDSVFGRRYAGANAGSWCCYAVRSICDDTGIEFPKTGYVPDVESWARRTGRWTTKVDTSRLQAVCFDWEPNGVPNHIGLVESAISGGAITLEANTTGPNGEPIGFWRKTRRSGIMGYVNLT